MFGKATVTVNGLNGEKSKGNLEITVPFENVTLMFHINAGMGWNNTRRWGFRINVDENEQKINGKTIDDDLEYEEYSGDDEMSDEDA